MPNPFEQAMGGGAPPTPPNPQEQPMTAERAFSDPVTRSILESLLGYDILKSYIEGTPLSKDQSADLKVALEKATGIKKKAEVVAAFLTPDKIAMLSRNAGPGSALESLVTQIGQEGVSKLLSLNNLAQLALYNPALFNALERLQDQYQKSVKTGEAISKGIQSLSQHWGIPATELEAVLSQPVANREAALETLIRKYNKGWEAGLVSIGLSQKPDLRAWMRAYAGQLNTDIAVVGADITAAISQLEPVIDFGSGTQDFILEGRVSDFLSSGGDASELSKTEHSPYSYSTALEALDMKGLTEFFGPDSEVLGNRLRAFRRQKAQDAGALAAGLPANASDLQIRKRIAEWWAGRYDPGTGALDQTERESIIREFISDYAEYILDQKDVSHGGAWRPIITPLIKRKALAPPPYGFDLLRIASNPELNVPSK